MVTFHLIPYRSHPLYELIAWLNAMSGESLRLITLRAFFGDLGTRSWRVFVQQRALPAVILSLMADAFEAALWVGGGIAALDPPGHRGLIVQG